MTSEDRFHDRVEDELAALRPPPIGGLAADALAHGRRIRRRQRLFGTAGGVAAVVGVAAGAVALSGGFASGGTASPASGGPPPTTHSAPASTAAPTPSPTPATSGSSAPNLNAIGKPGGSSSTMSPPNTVIGRIPASWKPPAATTKPAHPATADGQSVALILSQDLAETGAGTLSAMSGGANPPGLNANATLTWSTDHGSTRFSASVNNAGSTGHGLQSSCNPMYEVDYCAAGTLSDGTVVYVTHGTGEPADGPKTHSDAITIERPDHLQINVVEWSNGPLTDNQLYAIVSDPRWALELERSFVTLADQSITPFSG